MVKYLATAVTLVAVFYLFQQSNTHVDAPPNSPTLSTESKESDAPKFKNRSSPPKNHAWSDTHPSINLKHIFHGEINKKGKPVGFHSRPQGKSPENATVVEVKDGPNKDGVYTANIKIRDGHLWKSKFSSFFPDSLSKKRVVQLILHAYKNSANSKRQPWKGPSGLGFDIQGYTLRNGNINTAFPIYKR